MIDVHTHIFSPDARSYRERLAADDPVFGMIYSDELSRMVTVEELVAVMDEDEIEAAVVCGFPWNDGERCRRENDYIVDAARKYHGRILPFISIPPGDQGLKELEGYADEGIKGVGEWAPGTYGGDVWEREYIRAIRDIVCQMNVCLLVHYNEPVGHHYPGKGMVPLRRFQEVLEALQGVEVIVAHMGGGFFFYELMPEIRSLCTTVHYDTAAVPYVYDKRIYRVAVSVVGSQRLLFGSDFPLLRASRYLRDMGEAGLTDEELRDITDGNARRLLGIEQPGGDHSHASGGRRTVG